MTNYFNEHEYFTALKELESKIKYNGCEYFNTHFAKLIGRGIEITEDMIRKCLMNDYMEFKTFTYDQTLFLYNKYVEILVK